MGKKIDQFILSAATATAFYLYYQKAFSSRPVSLLLAFISFIVLRKTLEILSGAFSRFSWLERRKLQRKAGGAILKLAMLPEEEVQKKLSQLIYRCYGEDIMPVVIQNHPSQSLTQQQVFEAWKQHRGKEKLVICATSTADTGCSSFAKSLKLPKTVIIDEENLAQMIAEYPEGFTFDKNCTKKLHLHISHITGLLLNRKSAPRCLVAAVGMLAIFILSAKSVYLFCALALFLAFFLSVKMKSRPAKLF